MRGGYFSYTYPGSRVENPEPMATTTVLEPAACEAPSAAASVLPADVPSAPLPPHALQASETARHRAAVNNFFFIIDLL